MTIERTNQNGTLPWEDDAPNESRFRRTRQTASPAARSRRDPDASEGDEYDLPRPRQRFKGQSRPWWRPASKTGRVFLALGALAIVVVGIACWLTAKRYLERDARFRIEGSSNIEAAGLSQVSRSDLLPVFGEDIGRNIFFVNLSDRRKQLEQIPWIQRASVMRILPDRIRISVVERTPIAMVRQGQQIGLVDADGVLLTMRAATMTQHHYSFPVITGIDEGDTQPSRKARMAVYQHLMRDLDSSGQHFSNQISEIDLTDPEDARVLMTEPGHDILAHFGNDHFLDRYQRYKEYIAEWRQQYPHLAGVDLRYDHQVVVQMASGATADTPASTSTADGQVAAAANPAPATAQAKKPQPKPANPASHKDTKKHPQTRRVASNTPASKTANHTARTWDE
ncbi:cell division protein FtsQ/DivIB [Terracidiphilus gabretensis]|uniref:cell division protein FtsQ/DivIB n=1 Tax=Terracidiphilus gabretensis TaxID=1577687 RepID=UPI00071C02A8|nr:FtsQ-type POTRA domain-containing protein [Terracidiphilus gabretensis]